MSEMPDTILSDPYLDRAEELLPEMDVHTVAHILRERDAISDQLQTPEAIGSCSAYIVGPGGTEVLVTSRGTSLEAAWEQMSDFLKRRIAQGFKAVIKGNSRQPEPQPARFEPEPRLPQPTHANEF